MKKLSLLALLAFFVSCGDEDLYVAPDGEDLQAVAIEEIPDSEASSSDIFLVVEDMPEFPGGQKAYNRFLLSNLKYPKQARDMGVEGNVYLSFVVDTDGTLSDFELLRGIGAGCDEEALRVYMESPNWTPGKQRGVAVKTKMQARVSFKLSNADGSKTPEVEEIVEIPVSKTVKVNAVKTN